MIRVERALKGALGERVTVESSVDGGTCGIKLPAGGRVGLALDRRAGKAWTTSLCSTADPDALIAAARLPAASGTPPLRGRGRGPDRRRHGAHRARKARRLQRTRRHAARGRRLRTDARPGGASRLAGGSRSRSDIPWPASARSSCRSRPCRPCTARATALDLGGGHARRTAAIVSVRGSEAERSIASGRSRSDVRRRGGVPGLRRPSRRRDARHGRGAHRPARGPIQAALLFRRAHRGPTRGRPRRACWTSRAGRLRSPARRVDGLVWLSTAHRCSTPGNGTVLDSRLNGQTAPHRQARHGRRRSRDGTAYLASGRDGATTRARRRSARTVFATLPGKVVGLTTIWRRRRALSWHSCEKSAKKPLTT